MTLPANLPNVVNARLPATYEAACQAIAECARIDECADWANKAEAMAAYARMSEDDTLRKRCDRIQARAIRRCGELLKDFDGRGGDRSKTDGADSFAPTQRQAASEAGMSERQQVTAVRLHNIPQDDFDTQVESDDPPTVTQLAKQGTKARPLVDLEGRDPDDFAVSTQAQAAVRAFAEFARKNDARVIARGAFPEEIEPMRRDIASIEGWLDALSVSLGD